MTSINMPDEGWGMKVQEFDCPFCGRLRAESYYLHPDIESLSGLDKASFAREIHLNYAHSYDKKTQTWNRKHSYRWYAERWPLRPVDTAWRWGTWFLRRALRRG